MDYEELKYSFAYKYKIDNPYKIDGWAAAGDVLSELARQDEEIVSSQQFTTVRNYDFSFSPTYPEVIVVPRKMSQLESQACSEFRTKARIPALSYYNKKNGC